METEYILKNKMGLASNALSGKIAVVTGAAMGIGKQTALGLASLGADVAIIDKEREQLERVEEKIRSLGVTCLPLICDIAEDGQLAKSIDTIRNQWKRIDIFVSNAAYAFIGSFEEENIEIWDKVFNTNIRNPALAIKNILPGMIENGFGVVANVITLEGLTFGTAYSASKVGMRSLTTSLATELGTESGVSIFSFSPGIVDTPLVNDYFYPELARRFDATMQDIIDGVGGNPGYDGLMPVEDCGAALVDCIVHAEDYNGQVASPFLSLAKAGIIDVEDIGEFVEDAAPSGPAKGVEVVNLSLREYLKSVTEINRNLEHRINVRTQELTQANRKLQEALDEVKQLSGMLPICSTCKNIRDDKGYWNRIEAYLAEHTNADFSHSICPKCAEKLYGNEPWFKKGEKS